MPKRILGAAVIAAALAYGGHVGAAYAGKADDTLTWSTDRDVTVVDPYYNNTRELVIIGHMVWDAPLHLNLETGEYEPLLATSYEWVDDTTLDLELRDDVVFHNGDKLDAGDVVYTVNFVSKPEHGALTQQNVDWLESAEKLGEHKVRLHLKQPFPAAFAYLANAIFIMPEGHYDDAPETAGGQRDYGAVQPVGTGPYKVTEVVSGERIVMEANEDYFEGGPKGQPQIGTVVFRTIKEPNTQIAELLTGGIDWIWDVPKDQAERLAEYPNLTVENAPTMRISYLQFDVNGKSGVDYFTDKLVREAVAHAIDRESIANNLVGGASEVLHAACHPDQFGCTQDVPQWEYDPELAREKLAEAGHADGFAFDIYAYREPHYTEAVIGYLSEIGLRPNLKVMQYNALRELVWENKTPVAHLTWGSNSIPDASASTSHFFKGGRDDYAKDPEVIQWLEEADTTTDPEKRAELYRKALSKISGELYWLPMFGYAKYYAWNGDLDFTPTSDEIPRFYAASWK